MAEGSGTNEIQSVNTQPTETPVDSETAQAQELVRYLKDNRLALCIRGSTSRFADDYRKNGSQPESYGTHGYSYWTVFSPDLNPELLNPENTPKIRDKLTLLLGGATSYQQEGDEPLILTTFIPVEELMQNARQQAKPFDKADMTFWSWQEGVSSINIGKGSMGFPGFRTNTVIPPEKLSIYLGKPGPFMISTIISSRAV